MLDRRALTLGLLSATLVPVPALAIEPVFRDEAGLAIRGADPVAYHTESAYRAGSADHTTTWMGATWRFVSAENRARFLTDPERYAPQYGGYCAYAVSQGRTASIDPRVFTIVGEKLYLNYSKAIEKTWRADRDTFIAAADRSWPELVRK